MNPDNTNDSVHENNDSVNFSDNTEKNPENELNELETMEYTIECPNYPMDTASVSWSDEQPTGQSHNSGL